MYVVMHLLWKHLHFMQFFKKQVPTLKFQNHIDFPDTNFHQHCKNIPTIKIISYARIKSSDVHNLAI